MLGPIERSVPSVLQHDARHFYICILSCFRVEPGFNGRHIIISHPSTFEQALD